MRRKTWLWVLSLATSSAVSPLLAVPLAAGGYLLFQTNSAGFDTSVESAVEYRVWSVWVGIAFAIWSAIGVGMLGTVWQLRGLFTPNPPAIPVRGLFGIYLVYAAVIAIPFYVSGVPPALNDDFRVRVLVVVAVGLVAAAPAVITIWLVADRLGQLRKLLRRADTIGSPGDRIDELRRLRQHSLVALAALSGALSVAVLTIGGVRVLAAIVSEESTEETFPLPIMLLVGLFLTIAFALVYVPMLLSWLGCARQLVDAVYATPTTGMPDEDWIQERARLKGFLGLDIGLMKRLSNAFLVLAPFAVSVFTELVKQISG
ncbi:hypothetical protein [Streptomyces sp. UNOB3_S3]|uniref:hypothetical protein n=1 Tax=Streptomyces sp. UNOB3_S3 TaxID=2871682 RepID=UPI001E619544|nr:hypothetical protein [Streptomyces sp. UNOB3_S3]MCC3775430.1 hypothetical protein [Streptomyces sp. UNOB3_S3]